MKKIALVFPILLIFAFIGCEKEEINGAPFSKHQKEEQISTKGSIVVFYFTWDEWGRKKKNCAGGGLCNFRLESVELYIGFLRSSFCHASPVYKDDKNNYYVEIPIDDNFIFEDETKCLYVDEKIEALGPDGNLYMVNAATYPYYKQIGDLGGYRIPLVKK